jgi:hypothetical protein
LVERLIHDVLKQFVVVPEDVKIKFVVLVVENLADAALVNTVRFLIH